MARQYYYLVASLPELLPDDDVKTFNLQSYKTFIEENVHPADQKILEILALPTDNRNLINFLYTDNNAWDTTGNYTKEELAETLEFAKPLPLYMQEFIKTFENIKLETRELPDRQEMEKLLFEMFYAFTQKSKNKFIRNWFAFDKDVRNVTVAFAGRYMNMPFTEYLVGNDDITTLLQENNTSDFGLLRQRDYMPQLIHILEKNDLLERERKLDLFRWAEIDEMTTFDFFTIDIVAAFLLKASIIERWFKLDKETGMQLLAKLVTDLKESYTQKAQ